MNSLLGPFAQSTLAADALPQRLILAQWRAHSHCQPDRGGRRCKEPGDRVTVVLRERLERDERQATNIIVSTGDLDTPLTTAAANEASLQEAAAATFRGDQMLAVK